MNPTGGDHLSVTQPVVPVAPFLALAFLWGKRIPRSTCPAAVRVKALRSVFFYWQRISFRDVFLFLILFKNRFDPVFDWSYLLKYNSK